MSDMADYALDQVWNQDEKYLDYVFGDIDTTEAHDTGIIDDFGALHTHGYKKAVSCKYCGMRGLNWIKLDSGWRLHDNNGPHVCKEYLSLKDNHE